MITKNFRKNNFQTKSLKEMLNMTRPSSDPWDPLLVPGLQPDFRLLITLWTQ